MIRYLVEADPRQKKEGTLGHPLLALNNLNIANYWFHHTREVLLSVAGERLLTPVE